MTLESQSLDQPVFEMTTTPELSNISAISDTMAADSLEMPPPTQAERQTRRGMLPRPTHGSTASLHHGSVAGSDPRI